MKIRKFFAAAAAIVGVAAMSVTAGAYETFLMYTDSAWGWGCWSAEEFPAGTVDVTADGTYTVFIDSSIPSSQVEDEETGEMVGAVANGATVFCVDIAGLAADKNAGKDAAGYEDCKTGADKMAFAKAAGIEVSDVKITTYSSDGTSADIAVDQSKIIFGDIEGNGKIRIEIQNAYGDTNNDPAIDASTISFDEKIAVTFTISGIGGDEAISDIPTDINSDKTEDKGSPDTGVEGIAAVAGVAALAGGALLISKKRK